MEKLKIFCKIGVITMAIAGWCGMMYPELMLQEDIIRTQMSGEGGVLLDGAAVYYRLLDSNAADAEVNSRFLEWLQSINET